jgi:hypothetical protein
MRLFTFLSIILVVLFHQMNAQPQDRIAIGNQELFVSGGNVAWINFARDIGPGTTRLDLFEEMFREMNEHGGNAFRIWLHTNGASTPEFNGTGPQAEVIGPGNGTIDDLRDILDLAYLYDVALKLCLWSFDMLQTGQSGVDGDRNVALLTDDGKLQAYIDNALIPMVDSLKGHPAILAWEIFNEPEGMTTQFGWSTRRVSITDVQRFVNRTAGAIRRTDPDALITNGSWSFRASSDVTPSGASGSFFNFYRDDRLIAAGGDTLGYLDFYSVHYYEHFGIAQSPFHTDAEFWQLDKPIVIGEFFLYDNYDQQPDFIYGVPWWEAYERLYNRGYAGALGWQWFDNWTNRQPEWRNWPRILENIQTMFNLYRSDVELLFPGIRGSFSAFPVGIEAGQKSTLSWSVRGAVTVTLNGEPVAHADTIEVTPQETTTYILRAEDNDGDFQEWEVTVTVLDPMLVNRALGKPVWASSVEDEDPPVRHFAHHVNDGNLNTRWSSKWRDDEWNFIDLEVSFTVHEIVIVWETAFGQAYNIDFSFDGVNWETVYEERNGNGGIDTIAVDTPLDARFVRMHGLTRGTQWGFSIWEFEIYGLISEVQPPEISIVSPPEDAYLEARQPVIIEAGVTQGTYAISQVDFYIDSELVGTSTDVPYRYIWNNPEEGTFAVWAVAFDDEFQIQSFPRDVLIRPELQSVRFEAEHAIRTGSIQIENDPNASGGQFVRMQDATNSSLTWNNIEINESGTYILRFGFRLSYDDPKGQHIHVNNDLYEEVMFTGDLNVWLMLDMEIELQSGINTIKIEGYWGWMDFDYIEIRGDNLVSVDEADRIVHSFGLIQNYPNPFNPSTTISYSLAEASDVKLTVYDMAGRRVAILIDEPQQAGRHSVQFDASNLASGIYFYRIEANNFVSTMNMIFLK